MSAVCRQERQARAGWYFDNMSYPAVHSYLAQDPRFVHQ